MLLCKQIEYLSRSQELGDTLEKQANGFEVNVSMKALSFCVSGPVHKSEPVDFEGRIFSA